MVQFLIADNSQLVLEVLEFTIEQAGYQVFTARSYEQLIEQYTTAIPQFVLLSQDFDNRDGIELAKQLLAHGQSKILIMSNSQNIEIKRKAKAVGVSGWILKPFIPNHLIKSIIKTFLE